MSDKSISSDLIRGHIDPIILRVLGESDNYGYEIMKSIFKYSGGEYELREPSLYTSLKRLESLGYITSYWGDESQGGRRKYYTLTSEGRDYYERSVEAWTVAKRLIDQLIRPREE